MDERSVLPGMGVEDSLRCSCLRIYMNIFIRCTELKKTLTFHLGVGISNHAYGSSQNTYESLAVGDKGGIWVFVCGDCRKLFSVVAKQTSIS
jgi:hypothetical protein